MLCIPAIDGADVSHVVAILLRGVPLNETSFFCITCKQHLKTSVPCFTVLESKKC